MYGAGRRAWGIQSHLFIGKKKKSELCQGFTPLRYSLWERGKWCQKQRDLPWSCLLTHPAQTSSWGRGNSLVIPGGIEEKPGGVYRRLGIWVNSWSAFPMGISTFLVGFLGLRSPCLPHSCLTLRVAWGRNAAELLWGFFFFWRQQHWDTVDQLKMC